MDKAERKARQAAARAEEEARRTAAAEKALRACVEAPERLCVFCEHLQWQEFDITDWGGQTGASLDGGLSCRAGRFERERERPGDIMEFRVLILRARECSEFLCA